MTPRTRVLALLEVAVVLAAFLVGGRLLRGAGFLDWQRSTLGATFLSNALFFLALPLLVLFLARRNPGRYGLTTRRLGYHARVGGRVGGILIVATLLFPVIGALGGEHKEWPGAILLAAGFAIAGFLALKAIAKRPGLEPDDASGRSILVYVIVLAAALLAGALVKSAAPILTRTLYVLFFVALLEELFFRGYVHGRLTDAFGRPYSLFGTRFGPGLILAGLIFGLFHPLMSSATGDWPWALWTAVVGLVFGFVREKTGGVLASGVAHGIILLPQVAFG